MIKLVTALQEAMAWEPNTFYDDVLTSSSDLTNQSTVKQFVEYNGLPKIVNDIWLYGKNTFNTYPGKITNIGMAYLTKSSRRVEIEFQKNDKPMLYKFTSKGELLSSSKFSFQAFKNMML